MKLVEAGELNKLNFRIETVQPTFNRFERFITLSMIPLFVYTPTHLMLLFDLLCINAALDFPVIFYRYNDELSFFV